MKRFILILMVLASASVYAQKPIKPSLPKALASLTAGKLDEAKANIDAAIENEKMKTDGKTWYYRGLIYVALDTTSKEHFKSLAPDAFNTALEAFAKADEIAKGKDNYFTQDPAVGIEIKSVQVQKWANTHLNKGAGRYQEDDYTGALESFEKASKINPNDTTAVFYGAFAALSSENYDKAIENFNKYIDAGGKSADAPLSLYNIYRDQKDDKEKALEVVQKAKLAHPNNADLPKVEIGLLIDLKRIDEAKKGLETAIAREPNNKIFHFYLGYTNTQLKDFTAAKKNFEDALRVDPEYFDAQLWLAKLMYNDAEMLKKEMANLGISAADKKRKQEIDKILVDKLKVALPYWEKAEKLNPSDQEVIDILGDMYADLGMDAQVARIEKRRKELGME
jgi:tetratricopeptide (TPR) repeat protein